MVELQISDGPSLCPSTVEAYANTIMTITQTWNTYCFTPKHRGGEHHVMEFANGGEPTGPLRTTGPAPHGRTGTTVTLRHLLEIH